MKNMIVFFALVPSSLLIGMQFLTVTLVSKNEIERVFKKKNLSVAGQVIGKHGGKELPTLGLELLVQKATVEQVANGRNLEQMICDSRLEAFSHDKAAKTLYETINDLVNNKCTKQQYR